MSCCGDKRAQWNRTGKQVLERASPAEAWRDAPQAEQVAPVKENAPRVFEYLGRSSLAVTGANSRRLYHFAYPGHRLEIEYGDTFAIMAEGELKRVY